MDIISGERSTLFATSKLFSQTELGELAETPEENFTAEERREHRVFQELLKSVAGLEERLMQGGDNEVDVVAELASTLTKGTSGARGDDTKSLKGSVLDWITPKGQNLVPPLARNVKIDRGFHHERTGALLCPAGLDWSNPETKTKLQSGEIIVTGDQWPLFLYADYHYDPEDPWNGLFRSALLVCFCGQGAKGNSFRQCPDSWDDPGYSALNCIHCNADIFEDPDEKQEVDDLVVWWNRQIFPSYSTAQRLLTKNSALARIQEKRARMKESVSVPNSGSSSV
ncbi:hypothetical protein AZE42_08047 [Rhizopogon vesiculosus]|uniref:Uncharacterized protein n=1 Tax=Rhizopogon vesiculosus TaxID=180088 RepID=A0A1J8RDV6_9AGAM|nr:hypothetical protein AZE42_08047 [Rhizopogon vesiculosus]